ncbi:hypothetical protein F0562_031971 [Nyssa sinensis]|uniref:Uncharacterized protein n=1 Tax=Nyssa sinensis TaxID=561372 RepID=A0A5J5AVT0_9ASTE|nr:hypothetical protein F0562_031971 [Nyssa sinensis]
MNSIHLFLNNSISPTINLGHSIQLKNGRFLSSSNGGRVVTCVNVDVGVTSGKLRFGVGSKEVIEAEGKVLVGPATLNLTLPHQHPNPEAIVQEVERRINVSISRRQMLGTNFRSKDQAASCLTGNPIDDCWRCDPNWANNRQRLADCAIGFGQGALGGKGGRIYVVTDSSDRDPANPTPGNPPACRDPDRTPLDHLLHQHAYQAQARAHRQQLQDHRRPRR